MATKQQIIDALRKFASQRSGLEFGNYGDWKAYRAEQRSITKDLHQARELIRAVEWRDSITVEHLRQAFSAYSGRLSIIDRDDGSVELDYCTGQYFPTEYRRAVCAVCASALWAWKREDAPKEHAGDWLRYSFRKEFGRGIASRWFS